MKIGASTPSCNVGADDDFYTSDSQNDRSDEETQTMPQKFFDLMSGMINDGRKPGWKQMQL